MPAVEMNLWNRSRIICQFLLCRPIALFYLMRGGLCGKLHGRPSIADRTHPVKSDSHIFVENRDFCLPHLPPAFDALIRGFPS